MKITDFERRETVIVEHEIVAPGFYICEKIGDAIMPSSHEGNPFPSRDAAIEARQQAARNYAP